MEYNLVMVWMFAGGDSFIVQQTGQLTCCRPIVCSFIKKDVDEATC
jgi:hypothetical protein